MDDVISTLRELLESHDARQTMLADGDAELQAQKQQIVTQTQVLAALVNQVAALEQHIQDLHAELATLRGQVIHEDQVFDSLPYPESVGARWGLIDCLRIVSSRLQGWSDINARLFAPQSARQVMAQCSRLLKHQHDLLIGAHSG